MRNRVCVIGSPGHRVVGSSGERVIKERLCNIIGGFGRVLHGGKRFGVMELGKKIERKAPLKSDAF